MTWLNRFLLVNLTTGLLAGCAAAVGYLQSIGELGLFIREPLATAMVLWGFAASTGIGATGTGLGLLGQE
ncbi:hypothetical protein [Stappia indica]|uniref:Uncharacterized protein n=1 Tax=Stappia indica TaxID=538381 RepID=A0A285SGP7_9HYPH|nr:hypothetical protein [Stappia indica]SOC06769.1 hypothetical protein SAMN05421512_105202 [Stappia indica]